MKQRYSRRMIGLIVVVITLTSIPYSARADVIMTLEATSGSVRHGADTASGSIAGNFLLDFRIPYSSLSFPTLEQLRPVPGQIVDQSGSLYLFTPYAYIGGSCCGVEGGLNVSAIPSPSMPVLFNQTDLTVTAPFTVSGILTGRPVPYFGFDGGPFGDYLFRGMGTMTSTFRSALCAQCEYLWTSTTMTFTAPTIPEPSTWLLLATGLTALLLSRKQFAS